MRRDIAFIICLLSALLLAPIAAQGKITLSFAKDGIEINSSAEAAFLLEYPVAVQADKSKSKLTETEILSQTEAKLSYADGSQVSVVLKENGIALLASKTPAGAKFLQMTLRIPQASAKGGGWKIGTDKSGAFPAAAGPPGGNPLIGEASANSLEIMTAEHTRLAMTLPDQSFQQIHDGRVWNLQRFNWNIWASLASDGNVNLTLSDSAPTPGNSPANAAAISAAIETDKVELASSPTRAAPLPEVTTGQAKVLKWRDNAKAAFYLAFDDSCPTHLTNVIPELTRRGMTGTFYINPGNGPYQAKRQEWEAVAKLPGIELVNHTFNHKGAPTLEVFREDVIKCNEVLKTLYPERPWPRLISFGKPGGVPYNVPKEELDAVLKDNHLVDRLPFQGPPLSYKTTRETIAKVDAAIAEGNLGHVDFHGVGGDWHVASVELFHTLLDKLALEAKVIWLTDPVSAHQYATERKTAQVETLESAEAQIRLKLRTEADPAFYNLPLSLVVGVPADWKSCEVTQGETRGAAEVVDGKVVIQALPGDQEIRLIRG